MGRTCGGGLGRGEREDFLRRVSLLHGGRVEVFMLCFACVRLFVSVNFVFCLLLLLFEEEDRQIWLEDRNTKLWNPGCSTRIFFTVLGDMHANERFAWPVPRPYKEN